MSKGNTLCFYNVQTFSAGWKEAGIWVEILKENKTLSLHLELSLRCSSEALKWQRVVQEGEGSCYRLLGSVLVPQRRKIGERERLHLHWPFSIASSKGTLVVAPSSQDMFCHDPWKEIVIRAWKCGNRHHRNIFVTVTWNRRILIYEKDPSVP